MFRAGGAGLQLERDEREDEAGGALRGGLQDQILGCHEVSPHFNTSSQRIGSQ